MIKEQVVKESEAKTSEVEISYSEFQEALKIVNQYKSNLEKYYSMASEEIEGVSKFADVTKDSVLSDTKLSIRCLNLLRRHGDSLGFDVDWGSKVGDISGVSISQFSESDKVGKKSVQELKELCFYAGVELSH